MSKSHPAETLGRYCPVAALDDWLLAQRLKPDPPPAEQPKPAEQLALRGSDGPMPSRSAWRRKLASELGAQRGLDEPLLLTP